VRPNSVRHGICIERWKLSSAFFGDFASFGMKAAVVPVVG
jgi:hypothetical protein